ncbi:hypothetical protein IMZ48_23420 [Candidatus Bathyarchaeota archaeon]|nr:hypothetical protein [Candidatus Bathyarchaeota archaeon]
MIIEETRNEVGARRLIPRLEEINPFPNYRPDLYYEWDTAPCQLTVMDFRYGPSIDDWAVEWELVYVIDMKPFWCLVVEEEEGEEEEEPVFRSFSMPGGWFEECSDKED